MEEDWAVVELLLAEGGAGFRWGIWEPRATGGMAEEEGLGWALGRGMPVLVETRTALLARRPEFALSFCFWELSG